MQAKTKLYVDKNTPNVEKIRPNVDEKRAKNWAKSKAGAGHTMKNTRKGARGATVSPPKEKRPPAGGRGRGLTGAAPPTAADKPKPTPASRGGGWASGFSRWEMPLHALAGRGLPW